MATTVHTWWIGDPTLRARIAEALNIEANQLQASVQRNIRARGLEYSHELHDSTESKMLSNTIAEVRTPLGGPPDHTQREMVPLFTEFGTHHEPAYPFFRPAVRTRKAPFRRAMRAALLRVP